MKVKELISELQKVDQEFEVNTEGCDCIGDSYKVVEYGDDAVLIVRSDADWMMREGRKQR